MIKTWFCFALLLLFLPVAQAHEIPKEVAVRILISEAANQDLKGMICVGEVLRKRGSAKGFYGYKANRIKKHSQAVWDRAAKAWQMSAHTNYTNGADHFENVRVFGEPRWAKHCVKTLVYKDHIFYKEARFP